MKNIYIILVFIAVFSNCSNSEEDEMVEVVDVVVNDDTVIGNYKLTSIKTNNQEFINDCKSKDKVVVNSNKTFTITNHNEDSNCALQQANGTWRKSSTNNYVFTSNGNAQNFMLSTDNKLSFSFVQDNKDVVYTYIKQ